VRQITVKIYESGHVRSNTNQESGHLFNSFKKLLLKKLKEISKMSPRARLFSQGPTACFSMTSTDLQEAEKYSSNQQYRRSIDIMVIRVAANPQSQHRYFTEFTWSKAILYSIACLYVLATACIVMLQPFIWVPCHYIADETEIKTANVMYSYDPCRFKRFPHLLGLTTEECEFGRRLVWSVVFGCLIGKHTKLSSKSS
jgi:hypothetical protein